MLHALVTVNWQTVSIYPRIERGNHMAGMLQIITYLLAFYLVMKGVEILQIGLASPRESRRGLIAIGALSLAACIAAGAFFVKLQDEQAMSLQQATSSFPEIPSYAQ